MNKTKTSINTNPNINYLYLNRSNFWVPPIWIRPFMRPILIIVGGFFGGILLQLWKGTPPQWLLSVTAETTAESSTILISRWLTRILFGSALFTLFYITRLRNPFYTMAIGSTQTYLQMADSQAKKPLNAKWDTRSANDSMATRLQSMEKYLGLAMASIMNDSVVDDKQSLIERVDDIRNKGYSNAIDIGLNRCQFWAESGEILKMKEKFNKLQSYIISGGILNEEKWFAIQMKGYGIQYAQLLSIAQQCSTVGDVSSCQNALNKIEVLQDGKYLENAFNDEQRMDVVSKLMHILNIAHEKHVGRMLNQARKAKDNGSRRNAKLFVEQAQNYAKLHHVPINEITVKLILE